MTTPSERTPSADSPEETAETAEAAVPAPGKADAAHRRAVTAGGRVDQPAAAQQQRPGAARRAHRAPPSAAATAAGIPARSPLFIAQPFS